MKVSTCGIYKITNKILNKSYIGKSIHIEDRWKQHLQGKGNEDLYKDFLHYGKENFTFEIIEICQEKELTQKEKYWIAVYNTYLNGYNLNDGGDNSKYAIEKTKKVVYCYNLNGEFLTEYESLSEAERQTGISNSNISRAIKTKGRTKGYIWSYEKLPYLPKYKRKTNNKTSGSRKSVGQFSKNGELIKIYDSITLAEKETDICNSSISAVCRNKRKTAGGYIWKYL